MRKRLKKKKRSCPLCKPHKTGGTNRWKDKEFALLKIFEKEKRAVLSDAQHIRLTALSGCE